MVITLDVSALIQVVGILFCFGVLPVLLVALVVANFNITRKRKQK